MPVFVSAIGDCRRIEGTHTGTPDERGVDVLGLYCVGARGNWDFVIANQSRIAAPVLAAARVIARDRLARIASEFKARNDGHRDALRFILRGRRIINLAGDYIQALNMSNAVRKKYKSTDGPVVGSKGSVRTQLRNPSNIVRRKNGKTGGFSRLAELYRKHDR
ncbi:MAG: hypothetical protein DMG58_04125 [Acidobacteria bacterium]|nr:MAG: hypothetical protein DMG58_04125 [Acidobacteriota bacterium]